jgi:AraC family carnitine catabolism transcriptional activator
MGGFSGRIFLEVPETIHETPPMPHVCLVLFPGFQMLAYVLATETMRIANKSACERLFTWETRTATEAPVTASNGALIAPDRAGWSGGERCDLVLLRAGYDPLAVRPAGLGALLARADRGGAVLGGLDTGTAVLASLGFLAGHQAVLHYEAEAGFRESWPDIAVSDNIYCLDRRRLTAAGGVATGDAVLAWIAETASEEIAAITAGDMAHGEIRAGSARQRIQRTSDPVLREMKRIMLEHLPEPLAVATVARRLRLSPKQLRLRCRNGLGLTPADYYLRLRLETALHLLRSTEMTVTGVAVATGFATLAGFSRTFRKAYQATPRGFRSGSRPWV